ncbi:MAG: ketopantoate reductase C-terminal domain-containing protein [Bradyrhizobium sp.]
MFLAHSTKKRWQRRRRSPDAFFSFRRRADCRKAIMLETQAIAEKFGIRFRVDVERRIEGARKVGVHKTSTLQDLERGRPMEIDPLVSVVQEMGRLTQTPTPALDAVLALVVQRAKIAGLAAKRGRSIERPGLCMISCPEARRAHRHLPGVAASCPLKTK